MRNWKKLLFVPMVAIPAVFGACDNMARSTGPATEFQAPAGSSASRGVAPRDTTTQGKPAPVPTATTSSDYGIGWP